MFELKANSRDLTKDSAKQLRQRELIPAEVYGHNQKSHHVCVKRGEFQKVFNAAGESNLISLMINNKQPVNVLVKDVQLDSVTDEALHVDFYMVKMGEKLTTEIPLEFVGVAKAVKELGGFLVKSLTSLPVSCLPKDLVPKIEVDISALTDFDQVIDVKDVKVPTGIEVMLDGLVPVCLVQEPKVEAEEVPVATEETAIGEAEEKAGSVSEEKAEEEKEPARDKKENK